MSDNPNPQFTHEAQQKGANARYLEREKNIELVRKLGIRGITKPLEIQAYFTRQEPPITVTIRTIERYKAEVKRRNAHRVMKEEGLNKTVQEIAIEMMDTYRELTKEFWVVVHNVTTPAAAKVSALNSIQKITDSWVDKLQSLGLVHKEPEKVQTIGADGEPINPATPVNLIQMNADFMAYFKAKHQDPIGVTNSAANLDRKNPNGQPN